MSKPNDGGPAFPQPVILNANGEVVCAGHYYGEAIGISIRDYAAIKFIAAILANPAAYDADGIWRADGETAVEAGLAIADDFIAARNGESAQ